MQRRQRHLGRADQEQVVLLDRVDLLARLREQAGALHRRLAHQHRRDHRHEALGRQLVHAPTAPSPAPAAPGRPAGSGTGCPTPARRPRCRSGPGRRGRPASRWSFGSNPKSGFWPWVLMVDRVLLGHAVGGGRVGQVRESAASARGCARVDLGQRALVGRLLGLQLGLAGDRDRGVLALLLGLGDRLGRGVVRGPRSLDGGLQAPALTVQLQECVDQLAGAAARQRFADAVRLGADQLRVDHRPV